jgi:hypothetical protein
MLAIITGASSGLGRELAKILSCKGYDLILVSRNEKELLAVKEELKTNIQIFALDLSVMDNVKKLYNETKNKKVDIFINNAGFGKFGEFLSTDLEEDMNMIDLNIKAVHTLTKLYLKDMVKNDSGIILNVASSAAFQPGPLMSTYYATKSYVYSMSGAIYEELRRNNSNVKISVLCPGPFDTNFMERANVKFVMGMQSASYVANYCIKKMFKNKFLIIPGMQMKISVFMSKFLTRKTVIRFIYKIQKRKETK